MTIQGYSVFDAVGFDTVKSFEEKRGKRPTENEFMGMKIINAGKLISCIPVIGTIIGIAMLILTRTPSKERMPMVIGYRIRAVFQVLSLGALFLIPDLIFTIGRVLVRQGYLVFDAVGYDSVELFKKKKGRNPGADEVTEMKIFNTAKIISCIPVISTIVGIAMLILLKYSKECTPIVIGYRFRAVFQVLSLGALFLIPDLIFTLGRTLSR